MTFASTGLFASHVLSRPPAAGLPKPASAQTDPIVAADASAQTQSYADAASQTEAAAADGGGAEEAKSSDEAAPADAPGLLPMLRRAAPLMEDVLEENLGSTALDGYPPNRGLLGEEAVTLKCSLTPPTAVIENGLQCTGVEWNASGSVLVAAFGQLDLSGWCTLPGVLAVWSVFRRDLQPDKPPETSIEHSSCLMCVACHPEQPSLVAAGSFNGEVLLFDLSSKDQPLRHSSQINDYFHREPVAQLRWVYDPSTLDYLLSSVSSDGKVLFWSVSQGLEYPVRGTLLAMRKPVTSDGNAKGSAAVRHSGAVHGGTALAFVGGSSKATVQDPMVVASEAGALMGCSAPTRDAGVPLANWESSAQRVLSYVSGRDRPSVQAHVEQWTRSNRIQKVDAPHIFKSKPDPIALFDSEGGHTRYDAHAGPVLGLDASPFHRHLFLSTGADASLRLYSLLQSKPLLVLEPAACCLHSAAWSHTRPMVFAAAGANGSVYLFDLLVSTSSAVAEMKQPQQAGPSGAVHTVAFNPRMRSFLACGDANGFVHVWNLSWGLANVRPGETEQLDRATKALSDGEGGDADGDGGEMPSSVKQNRRSDVTGSGDLGAAGEDEGR